jgi:NADH dehydrogenase
VVTLKKSKRILILGAGVAGLRVAQKLSKRRQSSDFQIFLIDENDYHQYLYRIHEVCNVEYKEKDIIVPLSKLLNDANVEFIQALVHSVNTEKKIVITDKGDYVFDICVIALGSHVTYFGIDRLEENSMSLNSYEAAKKIRGKIFNLFRAAQSSGKAPEILIGGGGFTGVELAGELCDCIPILSKKFGLDNPDHLVTIVEAMPTILPGWDEKQVLKAQEYLRSIGVRLIFNDPVLQVGKGKIELNSGNILEPDLFIWTGGVRGDPACGLDFQIMGRRIIIDDYCRADGFENVYVAGDSACAVESKSGRPMPPTAHIAMVQGDIVVHNILSSIRGNAMKKYVYYRAGEIITLGSKNAIGELFGVKLSGGIAKFMKKVVHWWYLYSIGGFSLLFS